MSRRRYLSTEVSVDARINALAEQCGPLAVLLYTWMIPHAADDGSLGGDPLELKLRVVPGLATTIAEIRQAVDAMVQLGLLERDDEASLLYFRPAAFYRYQTYVRPEHRRAASPPAPDGIEPPEAPRSTEDQREPAESAASVSLSPPAPASPPAEVASATSMVALAGPSSPLSLPAPAQLSLDARTVLECWRQAHGKRSPPRLNPTQVAALEAAVIDLGVERLGEACRWSAEQGVTEFIKAIRAARTKRQRETQPVRPLAPAPRASPRPDPTADADWQNRDWNAELAGGS
jgi:hypothetical protein